MVKFFYENLIFKTRRRMSKNNIFCFYIIGFLSFWFLNFVQAEELVVTTYLPSPHGVYNQVRNKRLALGDNYYDNSQYCWAGVCGTTISNVVDLLVEGKVGIGTVNPEALLDIVSSDSPTVTLQTKAAAWAIGTLDFAGWQVTDYNTINQILFRTTNGGGADMSAILNTKGGGSGDGRLEFQTKGGPGLPHTLKTQMSIDDDGRVGIGTTLPVHQLELSTDSAAKPTSGAWTIVSDKRLKKDIEPFNDGLNVLMKINPVKYRLNGKAGTPKDKEGISVIAQKMKDIAPYTVNSYNAKLEPTDKEETELLNFDSSPLTFVLINAIKEQQKQIDNLNSELDILMSYLN